MKTIRVYDKPMCCSTGICGPSVDPVLPRFAADLEWLKSQGHDVQRYNLAQQPAEFAKNELVKEALAKEGVECLPLILFDGRIVKRRGYPSRELLGMWAVEHEPESTEEFQQNFRHALLEQFEERLSHAHDDHDRTEKTDD